MEKYYEKIFLLFTYILFYQTTGDPFSFLFLFLNKFIYLFTYLFIYLFIYFWLCWVFVSVRGLSLVAASGDRPSSRCAGLSLSRPLPSRGTGSRRAGSATVAHGPSCSVACGIFPDQGSNPCPLHQQADSQPLRHQGSPIRFFKNMFLFLLSIYLRMELLSPLVTLFYIQRNYQIIF